MKKAVLGLIALLSVFRLSAQYFRVSGYVADSSHAPIPEASIFITNGSIVGKTDGAGFYSFELRAGEYEVVFSHSNYQRVSIKVVLDRKDDTVNVILPGLVKTLGTVEITRKWVDPGPEMMRKAIARRDYWASRLPGYSAEIYIRAFEEYHKPKKTENVWHEKETEEQEEARKKKKNEEEPSANMAEILLTRDFLPPDKIKETRVGVKQNGDVSGLFYTTTTEGDFNFYQNLVKIRGLSDMPVMSPLSNTALLNALGNDAMRASLENALSNDAVRNALSNDALRNTLSNSLNSIIVPK